MPLIFGIDICEDVTQITTMEQEGKEPVSLCFDAAMKNTLLPTVLYRQAATEQWFVGEEAETLAKAEEGEVLRDFFRAALLKDSLSYGGRDYPASFLLDRYVDGLLKLLAARYPGRKTEALIVTCEEADESGEPARRLGEILKARCVAGSRVLSHLESFLYYTLHQPAALWKNGSAAFEYGSSGMLLYRLRCVKENGERAVLAEYENHADKLPYERADGGGTEETACAFKQLAELSLHQKQTASLFITGRGFDGEWASGPIRALSADRRVFKGQNLYTQGACYAALEALQGGVCGETKFFMPGQVTAEIAVRAERDGKEVWVPLVKPGEAYEGIKRALDVIAVEETELCFAVRQAGETEASHIMLPLQEGGRAKKTPIRYRLRISFLHRDTAVLQVKDMGFGEITPTSYRIYEKIVTLSGAERKRALWEG